MPEQSHLDFRQGRGNGKPADAEGSAVLFGETLGDESDVTTRGDQQRGDGEGRNNSAVILDDLDSLRAGAVGTRLRQSGRD